MHIEMTDSKGVTPHIFFKHIGTGTLAIDKDWKSLTALAFSVPLPHQTF